MQLHNGLHRATALQSAYAAALGEQSEAFSGIERAGETLTPVLDLWSRPEWAFLRDEILWARRIGGQGAVVAEYGFYAVVNTTTTHITVVDRIDAVAAAGIQLAVGLVVPATAIVAALDAEVTGQGRDTRYFRPSGLHPGVRVLRGGSAAVLVTEQHVGASGAGFILEIPWVLAPGSALAVQALTSNSTIASGVNFAGSIRRARPGEL